MFEARHARALEWVEQGKVDGLRIDHIDGLRDPLEYLQRLQRIQKPGCAGEGDVLKLYIIVEKITSGGEVLSPEWPTAGTTGYDYLNAVNTLFIDAAGSKAIETTYRELSGIRSSFTETWYVRKKQVMEDLFASDICMLSWRLARLAAFDRLGSDIPLRELVRSMLGIWPLDPLGSEGERSQLRERIEVFMLKAAREAKTHSSWVSPNEARENAVRGFIAAILDGSAENLFLKEFVEFSKRIAPHGACNALSQVLLKITSPGVPDFFQGNELWNFRLTDPDNRHEVDFAKRRLLLDGLPRGAGDASTGDASSLLQNWRDGRRVSLGKCGVGSSASLILPPGAPANWRDIFTGVILSAWGTSKKKRLPLADIFSQLPFALLVPVPLA